MKAIIIQDTDARALVDQLALAKMQEANHIRSDPSRPTTIEDMHRAFHYVVVRWLQEQGASVTR